MSRPLNSKDARNNTRGYWSFLKNRLETLIGVSLDEDIAKGVFREIIKSIPEFLCHEEEQVLSVHGIGRFKVIKDGNNFFLRMVVSEMMSKYIEELYTDEGSISYKESVKREDTGMRLRRCVEEYVNRSVKSLVNKMKRDLINVVENTVVTVDMSRKISSFKKSSKYQNEFEIEDIDILDGDEHSATDKPPTLTSKTADNNVDDGLTEGLPSVSFDGYVFPADVKPVIDFNFD